MPFLSHFSSTKHINKIQTQIKDRGIFLALEIPALVDEETAGLDPVTKTLAKTYEETEEMYKNKDYNSTRFHKMKHRD